MGNRINPTERAIAELDIHRSELIRLAVERHLEALQRVKLGCELAEGYTAYAPQALSACEELAHLESDLA
ncbi:MAG TPA: hypothetical protein VML19_11040 [Verrucomicrobiae bacterium]|nr:hypothetical protein [Verrucomicrobiae bacterium]